MVTTRRARREQSQDDQSPLRAIEMEPKSRRKVSREPKKIAARTVNKRTVDDNKVTKKRGKPGRPPKAKRLKQEEEDSDSMDEDKLTEIVQDEEMSDEELVASSEEIVETSNTEDDRMVVSETSIHRLEGEHGQEVIALSTTETSVPMEDVVTESEYESEDEAQVEVADEDSNEDEPQIEAQVEVQVAVSDEDSSEYEAQSEAQVEVEVSEDDSEEAEDPEISIAHDAYEDTVEVMEDTVVDADDYSDDTDPNTTDSDESVSEETHAQSAATGPHLQLFMDPTTGDSENPIDIESDNEESRSSSEDEEQYGAEENEDDYAHQAQRVNKEHGSPQHAASEEVTEDASPSPSKDVTISAITQSPSTEDAGPSSPAPVNEDMDPSQVSISENADLSSQVSASKGADLLSQVSAAENAGLSSPAPAVEDVDPSQASTNEDADLSSQVSANKDADLLSQVSANEDAAPSPKAFATPTRATSQQQSEDAAPSSNEHASTVAASSPMSEGTPLPPSALEISIKNFKPNPPGIPPNFNEFFFGRSKDDKEATVPSLETPVQAFADLHEKQRAKDRELLQSLSLHVKSLLVRGSDSITVVPHHGGMPGNPWHLDSPTAPMLLYKNHMEALTRLIGNEYENYVEDPEAELEADMDYRSDGTSEADDDDVMEDESEGRNNDQQLPDKSSQPTQQQALVEQQGSGSWLRQSFARVAASVNPLSWITPRRHARAPIPTFSTPGTEPGRKPLAEAPGTLLNVSVANNRLTHSEPRRPRGRSAGRSIGISNNKGTRARARRLQSEAFRQREEQLRRRESALTAKERQFQEAKRREEEEREQEAAAGQKRKRTVTPTGGRSTYSFDDISPASEESSPSLFYTPHTGQGRVAPTTPTRTVTASAQTPLFSILRRSGAGSEPAAKRARTGGRSVVWKTQLEEDSPLEKHEPVRGVQYVPRTPVRRIGPGESPFPLKSTQRPGVSRTFFAAKSTSSTPMSTSRVDVTTPVRASGGGHQTPSRTFSVPGTSTPSRRFAVPDDSSSDEDELMPETPSKNARTKSAGSTPHPVKTSVSKPPASPHPAHATLPTTPSSSASASTGSTLTPLGPDSPINPFMTEEERLEKARSRVNQFTPKQPSRLRESESTGVAPAPAPATDKAKSKPGLSLFSGTPIKPRKPGQSQVSYEVEKFIDNVRNGEEMDLEYALRSFLGKASLEVDNEVFDPILKQAEVEDEVQDMIDEMWGDVQAENDFRKIINSAGVASPVESAVESAWKEQANLA